MRARETPRSSDGATKRRDLAESPSLVVAEGLKVLPILREREVSTVKPRLSVPPRSAIPPTDRDEGISRYCLGRCVPRLSPAHWNPPAEEL